MPISVGVPAPDFTLKDQNNQEVRLADFRGRKAVLLIFYPLAFSRRCHGELTEIQQNLPAYANDDVQVLTVSVDSFFSHKVWADQEGFDFPLLADFWPHGEVAHAYGVLDEQAGVAVRGTFLIDRDGIIRWAEHAEIGKSRDQQSWRDAVAALG
ncbi:peroxiredoxin [Actinoplanes rectilineatus]|uniref:peroxiredoxin n=1 Tax=Actinoplanes rectilineatus TaxID=113571 RepID=UPI0005F2DACB|nr:peroxiredoxin [Actinoplanes rectilineatus]